MLCPVAFRRPILRTHAHDDSLVLVAAPDSAVVAASPITAATIWPRDLAAQRRKEELAPSPSPAGDWPSSRFRRAQTPVSMCVC